MAFLFLRILEFLIKAVGEEYKWSFIIYHSHSKNLGCEVYYFNKLRNHQRTIFWISPFGCGGWEVVLYVRGE